MHVHLCVSYTYIFAYMGSVVMSWHAGKLLEQEVVDALTPGHDTNRQLQLVLGLMSEQEIEMGEVHFQREMKGREEEEGGGGRKEEEEEEEEEERGGMRRSRRKVHSIQTE